MWFQKEEKFWGNITEKATGEERRQRLLLSGSETKRRRRRREGRGGTVRQTQCRGKRVVAMIHRPNAASHHAYVRFMFLKLQYNHWGHTH
ncbi:hypothetical protein VNO77_28706 [Canavalia gladiata]|uniref:Uncharacterized protein n=1 Tax=Canavalia gladiata TaxID=3824 RepID=A0AAN9KYL4_CANGL